MGEEPGSIAYFGYGSNNSRQLTARVQRAGAPLVPRPAVLHDWTRVFGGNSKGWGGAVASVLPRKGDSVRGALYMLTPGELEILDGYEGVGGGWYEKKQLKVVCGGFEIKALVYMMSDRAVNRNFRPPTEAYLCACWRTRAETCQDERGSPLTVRCGDNIEQVHCEWVHPGFAALGLQAILLEAGMRQDALWTLPYDMKMAAEVCEDHNLRSGAALIASGGIQDTGEIPTKVNEALPTLKRLLQLTTYELA